MMTMRRSGVMVAITLLAAGPAEAAAQRGARVPRGAAVHEAPERSGQVEHVLRLRAELDLSDAQVEQLEVIRREGVARGAAAHAEMAELRSRLSAGQAERSELRERMRERREADRAEASARAERIDGVLSDVQRDTLRERRARARAFAAGRASARRGPRGGVRAGRTQVGRGFRGGRFYDSDRGAGVRGGRWFQGRRPGMRPPRGPRGPRGGPGLGPIG